MKKLIETLLNIYLIWIFLPIITIIIIAFIVGYFKFAKPVYKEHETYGYGKFETAKIDPMTGEIIPKSELNSYDNSNKTILDVKGNKVYFSQINNLKESISSKIKSSGEIKEKELLQKECKLLLEDILGISFEIKDDKFYINEYWIISNSDCKNKIDEEVQKIYRKQRKY